MVTTAKRSNSPGRGSLVDGGWLWAASYLVGSMVMFAGCGANHLSRLLGPKACGSKSDSFFLSTSGPSQTLTTRASGPNSLITWRHAPHGAAGLGVGV